MMREACQHKKLSNVFYWHVSVECESEVPEVKAWYEAIRERYLETLKTQNFTLYANINTHLRFRSVLQKMVKEIKKTGKAEHKTVSASH